MKVFKGILALAAALAVTGCVNYGNGNQAVSPACTLRKAVYKPIYDVNKEKTVTGTASRSVLLWLLTWGDSNFSDRGDYAPSVLFDPFASVRQAATYNACATVGCDALIGTTYTTTYENYLIFTKVTCTVKGYPAVLKTIEEVPESNANVQVQVK